MLLGREMADFLPSYRAGTPPVNCLPTRLVAGGLRTGGSTSTRKLLPSGRMETEDRRRLWSPGIMPTTRPHGRPMVAGWLTGRVVHHGRCLTMRGPMLPTTSSCVGPTIQTLLKFGSLILVGRSVTPIGRPMAAGYCSIAGIVSLVFQSLGSRPSIRNMVI